MSENSFEKNQLQGEEPETKLEQELKAVDEKYKKQLKEELKTEKGELVEEAFRLFENDPAKLKEYMHKIMNYTIDDFVEGTIDVISMYQSRIDALKKSQSSISSESFFDEQAPKTIH